MFLTAFFPLDLQNELQLLSRFFWLVKVIGNPISDGIVSFFTLLDAYGVEKILAGKNCRTQKVHLEITLSKIRLDIYIYDKGEKNT